MKKKTKIIIIITVIFIVLIFPIKFQYFDGGSSDYNALTYKIIKWHRLNDRYEGGYKTGYEIHFFPTNFKSIDYYDDIVPSKYELEYNNKKITANVGNYSWCNDGKRCEKVFVSMVGQFDAYPALDVIKNAKIIVLSPLNITSIEIYENSFENKYNQNIDYTSEYINAPSTSGQYIYKVHATLLETQECDYYFRLIVK